MGTRTADCRKFTPNIFNKSKCSHCFRQREEHSAAALECNRASRKVSKCGYLFVAPDWDFNNPLHRTKRWQRRWFVLYDDGELTYSVDEHPETIPQACIDMTKVLEVTTAEDITGHTNSIAITSQDRVTFVKGTCPEEAKWWLNILQAFPRSKGRHKRNATFPGGQMSTMLQSKCPANSRLRHNSYHKDVISPSNILGGLENAKSKIWNSDEIVSSVTEQTLIKRDENNKNLGNEISSGGLNFASTDVNKCGENNVIAHQNISKITQPENKWLCASFKGIYSKKTNSNTVTSPCAMNTENELNTASKTAAMTYDEVDCRPTVTNEQALGLQDFQKAMNVRPKSLAIAPNTAPAIVSAIVKKIPPVGRNGDIAFIKEKISSQKKERRHKLSDTRTQERGDPDGGCTLDDLSAKYLSKTAELIVDVPADASTSKKGWLMKHDGKSGEWVKHWFVLRGAALFYYRDQLAEERGVLDGILDTNSLTCVKEVTIPCHYAFQLTTWDNRQIVLATISANCRNNWVNALLSAADIQKQTETKVEKEVSSDSIVKENISDDLKSEMEKDLMKAHMAKQLTVNKLSMREQLTSESISSNSKVFMNTVNPFTSKTILMSSDEEYRTASEGGRRDSIDWGSPLSPSPPLTKTMLRPRDRMRIRSSSNSRLHKRSRSSPPSSRRSTMDSVGSDDLDLLSVQEEPNVERHLQVRLDMAEKERDALRNEAEEREARMSELLSTLERTELQLTSRIREVEEARDKLSNQLLEATGKAEKIIDKLTYELHESRENIQRLEQNLALSMNENHKLDKKVNGAEIPYTPAICDFSQNKMKRVNSLSDLTNVKEVDPFSLDRDVLAEEYNELHLRFEKAINEIRAMQKELRESQKSFDDLELCYAALRQDMEQKRNDDKLQIKLLAERIQDLTFKYSGSERQVRMLKQKLSKSERRKSQSLKGKEILEEKVNELESKIELLEKSSCERKISEHMSGGEKLPKRSNIQSRRKSLESCNNSSSDSLNLLVRLNTLEKRIDSVSTSSTIKTISNPSQNISEHIFERLKSLEGALVTSKDKVEQGLLHLQSFKSARTRRSVSPMTDRKDSFKQIERCLNEVVKLLRESLDTTMSNDSSSFIILPESHPTKSALIQLENQLKMKLNELLKQRRILRERKELSFQKNLELTAERIAFESVCFGKLRDIISKAEDPLVNEENRTKAEVAETTQLIGALRAKLGGKCVLKPKSNLDLLAAVLARRLVLSLNGKTVNTAYMPPINPKVMSELLSQQNELNIIIKRYKSNALGSLGQGLASETLNYINPNDAVQIVVQEAWRQAQEAVNVELVQLEIAHIMLRNAQRFENSLTTSIGYALTSEERISFENFADAVHETLRKEMDNVIQEITQCYEESLNNIKGGQWRLHLEQERKASESRQLLSEFADIIAHKAMIDARITVLQGSCSPQEYANEKLEDECLISVQKYENLFEELANDLQISSAGDILIEADFKFMYKNLVFEFSNNESEIKEAVLALNKLDEAINLLQFTANSSVKRVSDKRDVNSLKDMCDKCFELCAHIECISDYIKLEKKSCEHCQKMQDRICNLASQHEIEIRNLRRAHESDIRALRVQIEEHLNSIKILECERASILEELKLQTSLIEDHERELATISQKLRDKEDECHGKDVLNIRLAEQVEREQNKSIKLIEENLAFHNKCLRQNEEYAALLQERDYVQAELNKERERARKLEKRLEMLETEHTKQLECLQEAYKEQIMVHCVDLSGVSEGESFHQRYQSEIEQLRTLCEKGLGAMESSHRRIISDLEEKHRQEIERLLIEKEQALAEETQATLAALDAMRKAHQSEVQREVARFKQDFIRQFQKGGNSVVPAKEKEEELEDLRQEILSFSEKYSVKCVENAALEEKLRVTNQKLKRLQHMHQLELRNKQFKAHLAADDSSDMTFVQGLSAKGDIGLADSEV